MNKSMMKIFLGATIVCTANVAYSKPEGFSCERIKEKAVRTVCIKDRQDKEQAANEERARVALAEKEREAESEKKVAEEAERAKAFSDFVSKSKQLVAHNLKDPDSAKFTNLVIAENVSKKLLCGSINAKNSYGGYVGAKKFYVLWDKSKAEPEVYTDGDAAAKAEARMEELLEASRKGSLSAKLSAAQEGDRVMAQARSELARSTKIMDQECTEVASTIIYVAEK